MRKKILLGKPIREHTPESLLEYVRSLYQRKKTSQESRAVPGITCYFGKKVIVRLKDKNRIFTDEEVKLLAQEYEKEYEFMLEMFLSRNIKIINATGELYGKPRTERKKRSSKGDAKPRRKKKKETDQNELQLTGSTVNVLQEESLPAESGT